MKIEFSGYPRPQQILAWLDRLPLSVVVATGIVLGGGVGGAGFYYLEAPGWVVAWLALFAALGWLGYTATPVFDEPNPVQAAAKPAKPRRVWDDLLVMVDLPGGWFLMGSPDSDDMARDDEKPQHEVTVAPFRIAIAPVTVQLYWAFMSEPSTAEPEAEARLPAANVTWDNAIEFCNRLSAWAGYRSCYSLRLAACAAIGARTAIDCRPRPSGNTPAGRARQLDIALATIPPTSTAMPGTAATRKSAQPVATKRPNPWGLYDLHGNVWEWCWDGYEAYSSKPARNPRGPEKTSAGRRVLRGGSFVRLPEDLRSASREFDIPENYLRHAGFRCVRVPPPQVD